MMRRKCPKCLMVGRFPRTLPGYRPTLSSFFADDQLVPIQ